MNQIFKELTGSVPDVEIKETDCSFKAALALGAALRSAGFPPATPRARLSSTKTSSTAAGYYSPEPPLLIGREAEEKQQLKSRRSVRHERENHSSQHLVR